MNLATLPEHEQKALQRDKIAALWAHNCKVGRANEAGVMRKILSIENDERRQDMVDRFNKYMNL